MEVVRKYLEIVQQSLLPFSFSKDVTNLVLDFLGEAECVQEMRAFVEANAPRHMPKHVHEFIYKRKGWKPFFIECRGPTTRRTFDVWLYDSVRKGGDRVAGRYFAIRMWPNDGAFATVLEREDLVLSWRYFDRLGKVGMDPLGPLSHSRNFRL